MGYINSIETMGLVDGPGIRFVVFLQGCFLRCTYCHNPETWDLRKGLEMTPSELVRKIESYKAYFGEDGGVTFSGGEPLLQPEFLIETMKLCHEKGINNCLDTSGFGTEKDEDVLKETDLVILDIKAIGNEKYQNITGKSIDKFNDFLNLCQKLNKRLWLRQVIVPGTNDNEQSILEMKEFIQKINNVEKIELLPYHDYGKEKYDALGLNYRLKETPNMDLNELEKLKKILG